MAETRERKAWLGKTPTIGIMVPSDMEGESVAAAARHVEAAGFAELWFAEDCGYSGGFVTAATALGAAASLRVGLAIMPALVRNPVFSAMEIATLCRVYPRRFFPGIGHGWSPWMESIGATVASPLTALEEVLTGIRLLLRGGPVTVDGTYVKLDNVQLAHPPSYLPPLSLGVSRIHSLRLSGRIADGTILAEGSTPEFITHALKEIGAGMGGQPHEHRITVISWCEISDDAAEGCARLRPIIAEFLDSGTLDPQLAALGLRNELSRALKAEPHIKLDDELILRLAIIGSPDQCLRRIFDLANAGADAVIVRAATKATHMQLVDCMAAYLPDSRRSQA